MNRKRAFTLIELLVVIAIIAILAAILFPVFAQAKAAAKKTAELSNFKQMATASLIYSGDFDDNFVTTAVYDFGPDTNTMYWAYRIVPYTKNAELVRSPLDTRFPENHAQSWSGPWISMASNSFCGGVGNGVMANDASQAVIGLDQSRAWGTSWFKSAAVSQTQITNVAQTIMFAPKYSRDQARNPGWSWLGVNTAFIWPTQVFLWDCLPGEDHYCDTGAGIPNGQRNVEFGSNRNYPMGTAGGVSLQTFTANGTSGRQNATFVFADGHAKSMVPEATNPDGRGRPQDNMWNSKRAQ